MADFPLDPSFACQRPLPRRSTPAIRKLSWACRSSAYCCHLASSFSLLLQQAFNYWAQQQTTDSPIAALAMHPYDALLSRMASIPLAARAAWSTVSSTPPSSVRSVLHFFLACFIDSNRRSSRYPLLLRHHLSLALRARTSTFPESYAV